MFYPKITKDHSQTCMQFSSQHHCRLMVFLSHTELYIHAVTEGNSTKFDVGSKKKVKFTLVHALRLCTGRTAHRRSRGIDQPFHDHYTRRRWGISVTPRPLFIPGKPVPINRRLGGPQGRSGLVRKISPPIGNRSPDRPARNQSLYRLSYPAHSLGPAGITIQFSVSISL